MFFGLALGIGSTSGSGSGLAFVTDGIQFIPRNGTSTPNVSAGSHAALQWQRTQAWSVNAKIKVGAKPDTAGAAIIFTTCNGGTPFTGYEFWINDAGQLHTRIISNFGTPNYLGVKGTTNVCDGVTHQVGMTYDGSSGPSGIKIYLDGVLETMTTESNTLTATIVNAQPFIIGNQTGWPFSLGGTMSEFMLSNIVRSAGFMAAYTTAAAGNDANTVLAYAFSEQTGTSVADLSSNGFTGTVNGARWLNVSGIVQSATSPSPGASASASIAITLPGAVASGNSIAGAFDCAASTSVFTIADDKGNSTANGKYVITGVDANLAGVRFATFYGLNITNGPTVITITISTGTATFWVAQASEIVNVTAMDGSATLYNASVSGSNSLKSGNVTTTVDGDLVLGICSQYTTAGSNPTVGTGFVSAKAFGDSNANMISEYLTQASAGIIASTFTPGVATNGHVGALTFKPSAAVNATQITVAFTDHAEDNTAQTTETFGAKAFAIGTAVASRLVVATITGRFTTSATISSVTIGGVSATKVVEANQTASNGIMTSMWQAAVPTGTTATISAVFSTASVRAGVTVSTVVGSSGIVPSGVAIATQVNTATPAAGDSITVTVPGKGGTIIGVGYSQSGVSSPTTSPTGYTETLANTNVGGSFVWQSAGTDTTSGSRTYLVSYASTSTALAALMVAAAYGP